MLLIAEIKKSEGAMESQLKDLIGRPGGGGVAFLIQFLENGRQRVTPQASE